MPLSGLAVLFAGFAIPSKHIHPRKFVCLGMGGFWGIAALHASHYTCGQVL